MNLKSFLQKKYLILLGIVALVFLLISLLTNPLSDPPKVIQSSPLPGSSTVRHADSILVRFDQAIDTSLLTITSVPEEVWNISPGFLEEITLTPKQYFRVDTDYVLNLSYEDEPLYSLNFKTIPQQSDPRYAQEVVQDLAKNYPLASKIPFENTLFRIVYLSPLTIEITNKNPNLTSQEIIDEVRSWVSQNGGNAADHKYVVAD